jgi:hypothetical protein
MFRAMKATFAAFLTLSIAGLCLADDKPALVKTTNAWQGSIQDKELKSAAPESGVITKAKDFEALVKAWKVADKVPEVDFDTELILVATTSGSKLSLSATLDDKGDMKTLPIATRDLGTGFRFVIISVPKAGVKTVNGKELPK